MKLSIVALLLALSLFSSCTDQTDGEKAASEFCDCLKNNDVQNQYLYAMRICDAQLFKKYKYYKIFHIDMIDPELSKNLSEGAKDSTQKFMSLFMEYSQKECGAKPLKEKKK
jgi:hypothetical protein